MALTKILSLLLCLCIFDTATGRVRPRVIPVSVDHCQPCPFLFPDVTDTDSDSSDSDSAISNTCQDSWRDMQQSLSHVIDSLSEFFHASRRHAMHLEAHDHGHVEHGSPDDIISAYNHLTNASLRLKIGEELLGWDDLDFSDRLHDTLCSLMAILRSRGITATSLVCGRSTQVEMRSRSLSHAKAMREMRVGLRMLRAVYSQSCSNFCDDCGDF